MLQPHNLSTCLSDDGMSTISLEVRDRRSIGQSELSLSRGEIGRTHDLNISSEVKSLTVRNATSLAIAGETGGCNCLELWNLVLIKS